MTGQDLPDMRRNASLDKSDDIVVHLEQYSTYSKLQSDWSELEKRARPTAFLTWTWIGSWLRETGIQPWIIRAERANQTVGLGLISFAHRRRLGFRVPALMLHQTGQADHDSLFIEFNGFLLDKDHEGPAAELMISSLFEREPRADLPNWLEFCLSGVPEWYYKMICKMNIRVGVDSIRPSPYVDLVPSLTNVNEYLSMLSRNVRHQIRRSMRLFESLGPLGLSQPDSEEQALEWLQEMKVLHQDRWNAVGKPGAFAVPFFEKFVQSLIGSPQSIDNVDMLRIAAGNHSIGYLLNLRQGEFTANYLSGFTRDLDGRYKPGLISHTLAISHYAKLGCKKYSFLGGDSQYKRSLATGSEDLYWLKLQKKNWRLSAESLLDAVLKR